MTPERWQEIERLYHSARERPDDQRAGFLAEACVADPALRSEVESLLALEPAAVGFMSAPALDSGMLGSAASFVGRQIGSYAVQAQIGAGGMGEVYRAHDPKLGRDVAIKILPRAFTSDPDRLARFEREARVLASLNHPHIGAIYGLEDAGTVRALVLELVDGPTLADRILRSRIPVAEALMIARQIADALEAAHEKGIIHRDLKPANIKITREGIVKVLDFGLAKLEAGRTVVTGGAGAEHVMNSLTEDDTREGTILGTAAYMSPEQARGKVVDKRTDIWSFGCVLYEMLARRAAFSGSTVSDILSAILEREPDWTALPNVTPAAIHRLLRRCLEKDATLRLHDVADARIEIVDALRPDQTARPLMSARRLTTFSAAVGLVALAVLGAWAVSRLRPPETSGPALRLQINPPPGGQFGRVGTIRPPNLALSPDGKTAVYGATVDGKFSLWLHSLEGTRARVLPGSEDALWPSWSPDGRNIAFVAKGKLQRLDVAGGMPFAICEVATIYGYVWTPDNRILLGLYGGTLATVPATGGTLSALTTFDKSTSDIAHVWPQVLPGGHFLYWGASSKPENNGVIYAASFEKPNERTKLIASETGAVYASGPDGQGYLLWPRGGTLVAQKFDAVTLKFSGEPRPIADGVGIVAAEAYLAVAVSYSGTLLYAAPDLSQLTLFDRSGKELGRLGDPGQYFAIRFSPDGKQIATTRADGRDLLLMDVDRGSSRRTTFDSGGGFWPQWSPDGRTIVFVDSAAALYRKDASGVAPDERLASWQHEDSVLTDWSPDGRLVLNTRRTAKTGDDIWVVPMTPDGRLSPDAKPTPYLRTPVNEAAGRFLPEPNPRWIAYQSDESGRDEVYIRSFPEPHGAHRISMRGGTEPQWGAGGREIFYLSPESKVMMVGLKLTADSVTASEPRELFAVPRLSFFEVTPDGQRFLVTMPDPAPHPLTVIVNWPSLLKSRAIGP